MTYCKPGLFNGSLPNFYAHGQWTQDSSAFQQHSIFLYDLENVINTQLERSFVSEPSLMKPQTFGLHVYSLKISLLFFNDSQKASLICPKTKNQGCRGCWWGFFWIPSRVCLFFVYCLSLLCLDALPSPLSALLNLLGSNLWGFLKQGAQCESPSWRE